MFFPPVTVRLAVEELPRNILRDSLNLQNRGHVCTACLLPHACANSQTLLESILEIAKAI